MNRAEIVKRIGKEAGVSQAVADKVLGATLHSIQQALVEDEPVTLVGFGTFSVRRRKPRLVNNPNGGPQIRVPAKNAPHFKPGRVLNDSLR